jgi:hypothetical protein
MPDVEIVSTTEMLSKQYPNPHDAIVALWDRVEELERSVIRLNAITMGLSAETANLEAIQKAHAVQRTAGEAHSVALGSDA